jgi:hypothetical protein
MKSAVGGGLCPVVGCGFIPIWNRNVAHPDYSSYPHLHDIQI